MSYQTCKDWRRKNPEKHMLQRARRRAKDNNLEFNLTFDDIKIPDKCPMLGIPIAVSFEGQSHNSPSLDRIDNTKGYTKDNIIIISQRANWLKSDATLSELKSIVNFLENK